jgi:hypothetical protein
MARNDECMLTIGLYVRVMGDLNRIWHGLAG